ncbi:MAG: hypothetical protein ACRESQ_10340, partial [Gammaproteobacteria bacterium]
GMKPLLLDNNCLFHSTHCMLPVSNNKDLLQWHYHVTLQSICLPALIPVHPVQDAMAARVLCASRSTALPPAARAGTHATWMVSDRLWAKNQPSAHR